VIALFQHGITQAVATLGTATTPDHAELLFRNAPDVYFCFDGDAAGRRAASKAMESVLPRMKDGRQAFFLFLPDGEDPDTMVRNEGSAGFDLRLRDATPLSTFFFDELGTDVNLGTLDGKARMAERAKPLLAQIPDGAFGDLMRQRLTELTGVGARVAAQAQPSSQRARAQAAPTQKRSLVRSAIALLLQQPSLALALDSTDCFIALRQPGVALLAELVTLVHERPDITTGGVLEHFADREEIAALQKLASQDMPGEAALWQNEFADAMAQLERKSLQQRADELQTKWREIGKTSALTPEEHAELRQLQLMIAKR
jgi:DNA primase